MFAPVDRTGMQHTDGEGTTFRPIGDSRTYLARYDDLFDGQDEKVKVSGVAASMNAIELQDREFFAIIREGRQPNAAVAQVLPCYGVLHEGQTAISRGLADRYLQLMAAARCRHASRGWSMRGTRVL